MAKNISKSASVSKSKTTTPARSTAVATTPVRNTAVPKAVAPAAAPTASIRKQVSYDMIAKRAFEISRSGTGGSELDNWFRAESELRGV